MTHGLQAESQVGKKMTRNCSFCGKEFDTVSKKRIYCSNSCKEKARIERNRTDMTCLGCGKVFRGSPDMGSKYCSISCQTAHQEIHKTLICHDCGKSFEFIGRTNKLRCDACNARYRSRYNMELRARKDPSVRIGIGSGKGQNPNGDSREHHDRRSAMYLNDRSKGKTRSYRKLVITGNDSCALCGYNRYQTALVVHHKDMNRSNNSIGNLTILCANCHQALHTYIKHKMREGTVDPVSLFEHANDLLSACKQ